MTQTNLTVPENILKRIFELINQIKEQYNRPLLSFSKELSFLAGEHACNMSTKKVPYGHTGIEYRQLQTPAAIAYSENIAELPSCPDPAQSIVVNWLSKTSSFSRILSSFTHTGIGIAESEDGKWYCCQIFATFQFKLTRKEGLLLVSRYINKLRMNTDLPPLAVALTATAKFAQRTENEKDYTQLRHSATLQAMFPTYIDTDCIMEKVPYSPDYISEFLKIVKETSYYQRIIRKDFTEVGFVGKVVNRESVYCFIIFGKAPVVYHSISKLDYHYPEAAKMIQLINDYRRTHNLHEVKLSHAWCRFANKYANKMMTREIEVDDQKIVHIMHKLQPNVRVSIAATVTINSYDPLREIFLVWISNHHSRSKLLSESTKCGFGMAILNDHLCYAIRIIGREKGEMMSSEEQPPFDPLKSQYLELTSNSYEPVETVQKNVGATFRLTG